MSVVLSFFLAVVVVHFLSWAYHKCSRNSRSLLGQLQGPTSPSFWIGERLTFQKLHNSILFSPSLFFFPSSPFLQEFKFG